MHCYEHKRYLKHFKRHLKHLSMTNNSERRPRAREAAEALRLAGLPPWHSAGPAPAPPQPAACAAGRLTVVMSVPLAISGGTGPLATMFAVLNGN